MNKLYLFLLNEIYRFLLNPKAWTGARKNNLLMHLLRPFLFGPRVTREWYKRRFFYDYGVPRPITKDFLLWYNDVPRWPSKTPQ